MARQLLVLVPGGFQELRTPPAGSGAAGRCLDDFGGAGAAGPRPHPDLVAWVRRADGRGMGAPAQSRARVNGTTAGRSATAGTCDAGGRVTTTAAGARRDRHAGAAVQVTETA